MQLPYDTRILLINHHMNDTQKHKNNTIYSDAGI